jgi:parallel beta-helix repeat protein
VADKVIQMQVRNEANTAWDNLNPKTKASAVLMNSGKSVEESVSAHLADGTQHAKTTRFVIGTSTAGWTAADCDYLCDGTADQAEINNAITALPATGGEIVILDGTYNITAKINVTKDNVSIRGNGNATILQRMFNSSVKEGVITLTNRSGCKIANLQIEGNKASYTSSNNYGIYLTTSSNNTVTGNACTNNNCGIYLASSSNNNTVTGNTCNNNNNCGIYLASSSNNNTVTGNTCNNNNDSGIILNSSSNNTVTGNTCNNNDSGIRLLTSSDNNTVTGNTCNNNESGIFFNYSNNNTITGNTCNNNNKRGIRLQDSRSNTFTGNTCIRGTGLATDYTASQDTIQLNGTDNSYNLISNNNCMGKAVTNGGGTGNTLVNNKFDAT